MPLIRLLLPAGRRRHVDSGLDDQRAPLVDKSPLRLNDPLEPIDADTLEQCLFGTFRIVDAFTDDGRGEVTFSLEAVGGAAARLRDINVAELQRSMEFMPAGTGGRQVRGKLGTVAFDTFLAAHVPSDDNHGRGMAGPSSRLIDRVVGGSGGGDAADVSQPRVVLDGASIASTASPQNGG